MSDGSESVLSVRRQIHGLKIEYKEAIDRKIENIRKKAIKVEKEALVCLREREKAFETSQEEVEIQKRYQLPRPLGEKFQPFQPLENCLKRLFDITGQKLSECGFVGSFLEAGSYFSQTSGGLTPDFDFLFGIEENNISIQPTESSGVQFRIVKTGTQEIVSANNTFVRFKNKLSEIFEDILKNPQLSADLPVSHGGFATPDFSGIRINQPAVTILLKWGNTDFSVDITPSYRIANEQVKNLLTTENIKTRFGYCAKEETCLCHLVPLRGEPDDWTLTTSHLETYIIKSSTNREGTSNLQTSIALLKTVGKNIFGLMTENQFQNYCTDKTEKIKNFIENAIKEYKEFRDHSPDDKERISNLRKAIGELLSYGHIFLPQDHIEQHSEILSNKPISFNSAALKYTVLNTYQDQLSQIDYSRWEGALTNIRQQKRSKVNHTFLSSTESPYEVHLFKVAFHSAFKSKNLLRDSWIHLAAIQLDNARSAARAE